MITLDTESLYKTDYYELNTKRTNKNAYESIDSHSEAFAAQANPETQTLRNNGLDQSEVIKALKLHLPQNRLYLLKMLNHSELSNLLFLIDKNKLVLGLKFFTKDKLLQNIYNLPKEQLLKILFATYSKDEFLAMMPMKELNNFLESKKINPGDMMKFISSMPKHLMAQILESATGKPVGNKNVEQLISELSHLNQDKLVEGLKTLPNREKLSFITKLLDNNNELYMEFSKPSLIDPITRLGKDSIIEGMRAIDPETIIKMMDELPNNMLAIVNTMIEQDKFTAYLQQYHSDLLSSFAA